MEVDMAEALEALYGFTMWIVKAALAIALVGAAIAAPIYAGSTLWHRAVRGDRRCAGCNDWFRSEPGRADTRCSFCRGDVAVPMADRPVGSTST
jgi:hypothetical protein